MMPKNTIIRMLGLLGCITLIILMFSCGGDEKTLGTPTLETNASLVDLSSSEQVIRGFGGATVFQPPVPTQPLTDTDVAKLFGTGNGQLGLSILRIRVAPDDSWRAIELSNAKKAIGYDATVIASPWSPPSGMKTNNDPIGGALKTESYEEYATYLADFAQYMEDNDAPLYGISIQNEPDITVNYESCDWTAAQMTDFLAQHGATIQAKTKVIAPECFQFNQAYSNTILANEDAAAAVDIVGGHIYGGGLTAYPNAISKGKELWMTEHLVTDTTYSDVLATAKEIHDCMTIGNYSAYIWWYLKRFYGPMDEDGIIKKRGYIMAQFSKFIRPGYVRVTTDPNPKLNLYVSAYKGDKVVIVAVNLSTGSSKQQFAFENGSVISMTPYITTSTQSLSPADPVTVGGELSDFTYTLPAKSVVTFVQD